MNRAKSVLYGAPDPKDDAGITDGFAFRARPFGQRPGDLDLDFVTVPRPHLLTDLLTACLRQPSGETYSRDDVWQWSVAQRLQGLLSLSLATFGARTQTVVRCPLPTCLEQLELDLDLTDFERPRDIETFTCSPTETVELQLRLPTGQDQERWLGRDYGGPVGMATELVTGVNGEPIEDGWCVPEPWLERLEEALEERDALTALWLEATCPHCHQVSRIEFDLEAFLVNTLARMQWTMMDQVHNLALHYHWSEADILSLPPGRRDYYLRRLDGTLAS